MRSIRNINRTKHMNDRGAAMITVILTILIIMIMASSLLTMASMNYRMRMNNYRSKQNEYKTELALENIRAELRNDLQTAVQGSADKALTAFQYLKNPTNFAKYFSSYTAAADDGGGLVTINADASKLSYDATKTVLKDVDIVYTENGMKTHLVTDICLEFPKVGKKAKLMDYSFIALNGMNFSGSNVKKVTIHGNVYAKSDSSLNPALKITCTRNAEIIFTGNTVTIDGDVYIGKGNTLTFSNISGGNATIIINGKVTLQDSTATLSISPSVTNLYIKDGVTKNGGKVIPDNWEEKINTSLANKVQHLVMDDVLAADKQVKARVGNQEVTFDHFGYVYAKDHGQQDASHWIDPNQVMNGQGLEGENTTILFSRTNQTIPINNDWSYTSTGKSLVGILINPSRNTEMSFQVAGQYAGMFVSDSSVKFSENNDTYEIMPYTQAHNMEDAMDKWIHIGQLNNKPVYVQLSALFADDLVQKLGAGTSSGGSGGTQTNAVWVTFSNWSME
ncbi:MAG: hypothetical protein IK125_02570 [Lachnospiraceae bacterium]|nr:hypothetical protein [Lachnospiraceae bacterium]